MANNTNGRTLQERLFSRLLIDRETGCILWTGPVNRGGYGKLSINGRARTAHQAMYEMFIGPIPGGMQLDHLCRVRRCANPAHLEAVTSQVNTLRGDTIPAAHAHKTHCAKGHAYTSENTYIYPHDGSRACRICRAQWVVDFRAKRRSA